jgi:hypothetical protein
LEVLPLESVRCEQTHRRAGRFVADAVIAVRALRRFMAIDGATLEDARRILEAAGPGALIAAFGGAPERASADSPARRLQAMVRKAAAAGLFGEVVAEIEAPQDEPNGRGVASLDQARLTRALTASESDARRRG